MIAVRAEGLLHHQMVRTLEALCRSGPGAHAIVVLVFRLGQLASVLSSELSAIEIRKAS